MGLVLGMTVLIARCAKPRIFEEDEQGAPGQRGRDPAKDLEAAVQQQVQQQVQEQLKQQMAAQFVQPSAAKPK
eukprot:NODE_8751_length_396_cov_37.731988_g7867_i0.p3 GENE.NODE_8751_length_396_cov_37.731988_g7867_i0~~NODE_8751_length_396_cov_37.731988_g7867_i0.p3  ORF type:complete len:81 (+),score=40.17 NODE_8751_length_396_cov_37.731988_g7867_i0:27-245(+)